MINLSKSQPVLRVVDDQKGCPTWTFDLAEGILTILKNNSSYGIYHVCGTGFISWYGFAKKILELKGIKNRSYSCKNRRISRPAKRPKIL